MENNYEKIFNKTFYLFSLLLTVTSNVSLSTLDITDNTNDIEVHSDIPLKDGH